MEKTIPQTATFLKRHAHMVSNWPHERLLEWLEWYAKDGRLAICLDSGKQIIGAGVARGCKPENSANCYAHDEKCIYVWVDLVAVTHRDAWKGLVEKIHQRFGGKAKISFRRSKDVNQRIRFYPFNSFFKKILQQKG